MNRKNKTHNILIYVLLICFTVLCLVGAWLFRGRIEDEGKSVPLYIEMNYGCSKVEICPWFNDMDGKYYVFLPAGCQTILIRSDNNVQVTSDKLQPENEIASADLLMGKDYSIIIENGLGLKQALSLVFMKSDNIPALFISTESGSMDYINTQKGNAESGTFQIISDHGDSLAEGNLLSLAGRGNTSWTGCEKRGYKFILEQETALLGLRTSSEWILTANARSNYLSNSIAFWLEQKIGMSYYTDAVFIDLYFNGQYNGNYILCEKISTGAQGIPLQDLDVLNQEANSGVSLKGLNQYSDADGRYKAFLWKRDPEDITGGFLIERDVPEYYADEKCGIRLTTGDHYVIQKPSKATVAEAEYLWKYMEEMHQAVASLDGYSDSGHYYSEYLDMESFALKYILEEFLAFNDAGRSSAYYYKDSGDILRAGPGWDFEGAFLGNSQYLTKLNGTSYSTALFEQLMQHEDFRQLAIQLYHTRLRPAIQQLRQQKLYELRDLIAASAEMDMIRWNREDFFDSCNRILNWIDQRILFLDQHWNTDELWVCLKFVSDWSNHHFLYLRPGESVTQLMVDQFAISQVSEWVRGDGEPLQYNVPQYEDDVLYGISNTTHRGIVNVLMGYAMQVLPELLFVIVFVITGLVFLFQTKKGRWKK